MELMITIAVAGVILAIAIPSFSTFRLNARMTGAANDLLGAVNLARSEAIKRQLPVAICGSVTPRADPPACDNNLTGWVVWEDTNDDRAINAGEPVLAAHDPLDAALTVTDNFSVISYAGSGFPQDVAILPAVLLCDERGNAAVGDQLRRRMLSVSRTGRPAILRTTAELAAFDSMQPPPIVSTCNAGP